jgi:hypothetical protein
LRRVVEKVIGEELVEYFEISTALHFFGIATNDRFRGLARIDACHDLPPIGLRMVHTVAAPRFQAAAPIF